MFNDLSSFNYAYAPILALSPSEMTAIEELPDKDKDSILPIIPIKGWTTSRRLENSIKRIKKAIGNRYWIADLEPEFLSGNKAYQLTGEYPREVFYEIEKLLESNNGYDNWYKYLVEIPEAIPTLQLKDLDQLNLQIEKLTSLGRGIVVNFSLSDIESGKSNKVIEVLSDFSIDNIFIIYDLGTIERKYLDYSKGVVSFIQRACANIPNALVAISSASFPSNFGGTSYGENSIYERLLYNKVSKELTDIKFIYSDRGGARAEKQNGGGGIPAPRIDYPLKNDWRYIRKEFNDPSNPQKGEKEMLYTMIAKEMLKKDYWISELHLWGTQMIDLTSQGDKFGINSPQKATAVRINIHLYNQLHYNSPIEDIDTDEDWED